MMNSEGQHPNANNQIASTIFQSFYVTPSSVHLAEVNLCTFVLSYDLLTDACESPVSAIYSTR